ncbi:hypothetical protein Q8A67_019590 [Cirrhinus molitorella]|uniref:Ribosomal protein L13a n=1 Tax=Cirrhinus molitorella TaxID=172907 RepID=A0AA88TDT6_9TELE|nr:hypothetical protein Q8A67_019590 [Cirrhinus molitorella]
MLPVHRLVVIVTLVVRDPEWRTVRGMLPRKAKMGRAVLERLKVDPSRIFWRTARDMLPCKAKRDRAVLERLKVYDGILFTTRKRMVVPAALKIVRLKSTCRFALL